MSAAPVTIPHEDDMVGEDDVFVNIEIFPGVEVRSGYADEGINELSKKIIRLAFLLAVFQTLVSIFVLVRHFSPGMVILQLFNVCVYLAIYWTAIQCVKSRNAPLCCNCCCRPLSLYRTYLAFTIFILFIIIAVYIGAVATRHWMKSISLFISCVIFGLNCAELYFSSKLIRILYTQVHIAPPEAQGDVEMASPYMPTAQVVEIHTYPEGD
jgi:hypothetical protein